MFTYLTFRPKIAKCSFWDWLVTSRMHSWCLSPAPDKPTASHLELIGCSYDCKRCSRSCLTFCFLRPQFHFNPAQSILVMEGEDLENMNAAVRKVSYINSRQFPTPGIRRLHISTVVQCVQFFSSSSLSVLCSIFLSTLSPLLHLFPSASSCCLFILCTTSVRYEQRQTHLDTSVKC